MSQKSIFIQGMKDGFPIFLGYLAVSFTFGIQADLAGLSLFQSGLLSLTNVTSAGQFAGLTSIKSGALVLEVILTQFIINSRYMLMSSALSQKISPDIPFYKRALMAMGVTDEIFGLSVTFPGTLAPHYTYGLMASAIPGWVLGTVLGAISGTLLPDRGLSALSIALYGMLIAIIIPPSRTNKVILGLIVISMTTSFLFTYLPLLRNLSPEIRMILLTLIITSIAAYAFPVKEEDYE